MKNALLALAALLTLNAYAAGAPDLAIDPVPPQEAPVISILIAGGMPGPFGGSSHQVTVMRTGRVVKTDQSFDRDGKLQVVETDLTPLEPIDMLTIGEAVGALKGGKLEAANGPLCEDAPGATYTVYKGQQKLVVFARYNCQDQELRDRAQREFAETIRYYLDNVSK